MVCDYRICDQCRFKYGILSFKTKNFCVVPVFLCDVHFDVDSGVVGHSVCKPQFRCNGLHEGMSAQLIEITFCNANVIRHHSDRLHSALANSDEYGLVLH